MPLPGGLLLHGSPCGVIRRALGLVFASVLCAGALGAGRSAVGRADPPPARSTPWFEYLPTGSQCRGLLPCDKSGNYGIHARLLGAIALDEQYRVRDGLLVPSLILSAMEIGECGVAFPLRFYELDLPVPERLRLFCKVSLPKSVLPSSGAAVLVNVNLATGPFTEAAAPSGARDTTVDVGVALGGALGFWVHAGAAVWATLGQPRPELHAGPELLVRTDAVILFLQAQFRSTIGLPLPSPVGAWGLLGTFGVSFPSAVAPTGAHLSLGRGEAAPSMLIVAEGGVTYDVKVRDRYGDGAEAVERWWQSLDEPRRYRRQLRRLGYFDPYADENGLLRHDVDHSVLGIVGIPDPTRPGYILTPTGISIPIGAALEIRSDRPFVASPAFPGRVLSYIPLLALTQGGGALTAALLDPTYFDRLEDERRREELAVQDALRQMDTPWAQAALNAAVGLLTEPVLMFLAAASADTPDLATQRRQARLWPYRAGSSEYKGELAETVLSTYGSLLGPWAAGMLRTAAAMSARELASALATVRAPAAVAGAGRAPPLLTRLAPRLNPLNYRFDIRGLGSNLGNLEVSYARAAAGQAAAETEQAGHAVHAPAGGQAPASHGPAAEGVAEHLLPPEPGMPPLSDKARAHIYFGDVKTGESRGWHFEPTGDAASGTYVVESTRSAPDAYGAYEANVYIQGVKKNARSSFFPASWTATEVETAIAEAYQNRQSEGFADRYRGCSSSGLEIRMHIDSKGRIRTAYPIYKGGS